jgi:mannitol/fructose-specific phosphotransferase system IIA component (Ntr-type)
VVIPLPIEKENRAGYLVRLQDILPKNGILLDLKAQGKTDLLSQMGNYLASLYNLGNTEMIEKKLLERETEMSTGIGFGIAIPHARVNGIDRVYIISARTAENIEYEAIDEQPVRLVFMLISPANTTTEHTMVLSALSRTMSYEEVRTSLLKAPDVDTYHQVIAQSENKYVQ